MRDIQTTEEDRRLEVYESTGEFVTMELTFSRTNNKNRATRRSLVNVGGKGAEVGRYFRETEGSAVA